MRTSLLAAVFAVMFFAGARADDAAVGALASTDSALVAAERNPKWAQPIEKSGLPNFFKVSDDLYRGAQPTAEGFRELEKMGVKTVLNLRAFHSDTDLLEGTALRYEYISFKAWHPEDEDVVKFLKIVTDKKKIPIFVHCQHGSDRTGTMVAIYRIIVQGWTKRDAIKEMTQGGYGFHTIWEDLIDYIQQLDVDRIKRAAGLESPAQTE